jgi:superfamily I DNA/RNA helicase
MAKFLMGKTRSPFLNEDKAKTGTFDDPNHQFVTDIGYGVDSPHVIVDAVAGSGKTTVALSWLKGAPDSVYVAFSKGVQQEMEKRSGGVVASRTYHSIGFKAVRNAFGSLTLDNDRSWGLIDAAVPKHPLAAELRRLLGLAKQYGGDTDPASIIDTHGLDFGSATGENEAIALLPGLLDAAATVNGAIDYDDMCWLPYRLNLPIQSHDFAVIDEAQDTNIVQQYIGVKSGGRILAIGDRRQAIFGFRGADTQSMTRLEAALDRPADHLPLSTCWRCPESHLALARRVVPQITAAPGAPDGIVTWAKENEIAQRAQPGDLVLSRVNAPLISIAYDLIAAGRRAFVRGKDVAEGLLKFIGKCGGQTVRDLLANAMRLTAEEVTRLNLLPNGRGKQRIARAWDRYECLEAAARDCSTAADVKAKIVAIFAEGEGKIRLGTIHSLKGMEAPRVFILRPDLLPHPLAVKPWEKEQEDNLYYVAVTRAKWTPEFPGEIIFVHPPDSVLTREQG